MGESRPPLRAAFWAISAALLLMLLAALSDPYRVRQSLLARRDPAPPNTNIATTPLPPSGEGGRFSVDRVLSDDLTPDNSVTAPESALIARQSAVRIPPTDHAAQVAPVFVGAQMQVVSAGDARERRHITRPLERPAMPILSPGELTGPTAGGRFEELPPPPEFHSAQDLIADGYGEADGAMDLSLDAERALERLRLETEVLTLRDDLNRLIASRQLAQIEHVQQRQSDLLERQQQTAERIEQLADQLAAQSARLDRLFEERGQLASPSEPDGRHRLSLVIESDDVPGVLERLGRWSAANALAPAAPPVTRSAFVEPQPRYLAPPPAHSDPAPLSDLQSPPDELVSPGLVAPAPRPMTGGPLFAPPAICR
jgi:hypothetical protein